MSSVRVRYQTIEFGEIDIHVRTLRDNQQFSDDDGVAEQLGISSASWPLFGIVWDTGRVLANLMLDYDISGRRVLEVGCGIGLASLILRHRGEDITATDCHPDAEAFLVINQALNIGADIPFVRANWEAGDCGLGEFDLIIASDVIYEIDHVDALSGFIDRHAKPICEVIVVDPGRGQQGRFRKRMASFGYTHASNQQPRDTGARDGKQDTIHTFCRSGSGLP